MLVEVASAKVFAVAKLAVYSGALTQVAGAEFSKFKFRLIKALSASGRCRTFNRCVVSFCFD